MHSDTIVDTINAESELVRLWIVSPTPSPEASNETLQIFEDWVQTEHVKFASVAYCKLYQYSLFVAGPFAKGQFHDQLRSCYCIFLINYRRLIFLFSHFKKTILETPCLPVKNSVSSPCPLKKLHGSFRNTSLNGQGNDREHASIF